MTFVKYGTPGFLNSRSFQQPHRSAFRIFPDSPEAAFFNRHLYPKVDIIEKENEVILKAELPGMKKEGIKLAFENGLLTLSGEIKNDSVKENESSGVKFLNSERFYGTFSRSFRLSEDINQDSVQAKYESGILTIQLSKKEQPKEKIIEVN